MSAFQRALTDFGIGVDIAHLQAARERLMAAERVPNTLKAYSDAWEQFRRWCAHYDRDPLPASSDTIQLFITASIERGRRLKTVKCYLSGIIWKHVSSSLPSPIDDEIRALMKNAARALKEKPVGRSALTPEQLREICECRYRSADPMDVRDRSMFLIAFAAGWRGSEVMALDFADVEFREQGVILRLGASKTDQEGKGRVVGLHKGSCVATCPVEALRHWIEMRGDWEGPLFVKLWRWRTIAKSAVVGTRQQRITRETLGHRLKSALEKLGVDATHFGSHSLRVGMVTASSEAGYSVQQIMGRTGQKTSKTVEDYIRRDPDRAFHVDPLKGR